MTNIKNIIFDVSEVLTKRLHDFTWSNRLLAEEYGIPLSQIEAFFEEFIHVGGRVQGMSVEDFWNIKTVDMGNIPLSALILSTKRHENDLVVDEEMVELLKTLQPNYRLFALTNAWKPGHPFKAELEGYFEAFVQSCDIKLKKPDPAVFRYMLDTYDLKPEETLFIDNKLKNTKTAREFGMQIIHFINAEQCIKELRELNGLQ